MIDFVTTFNEEIFNKYGKNIVDTFLDKSQDDIRLNIFHEGNFEKIKDIYFPYRDKIRFFEFNSKDWNIFHNKFGHLMEANGYKFEVKKSNHNIKFEGPSYKWQAVKFSYKVFTIYLASQLEDISKKIIWLDADTVCINTINEKNMGQFLPQNDELMTYLGRDQFPPDYPHSETGFIGFNLMHEKFNSFIKTAISFYTTGEIFALKYYHDCVVYDTTRSIFEMTGTKFRCLSGEFKSNDHPFVKCGLGLYFDHLKGKRKDFGFSPEHPNYMKDHAANNKQTSFS